MAWAESQPQRRPGCAWAQRAIWLTTLLLLAGTLGYGVTPLLPQDLLGSSMLGLGDPPMQAAWNLGCYLAVFICLLPPATAGATLARPLAALALLGLGFITVLLGLLMAMPTGGISALIFGGIGGLFVLLVQRRTAPFPERDFRLWRWVNFLGGLAAAGLFLVAVFALPQPPDFFASDPRMLLLSLPHALMATLALGRSYAWPTLRLALPRLALVALAAGTAAALHHL